MASELDEMTERAGSEGICISKIEGIQDGSSRENAGKNPEFQCDQIEQELPTISPPKRRGRPPKAKPLVPVAIAPGMMFGITKRSLEETSDETPKPPPKRRGRPRKDKSAVVETSSQPLGEDVLEAVSGAILGDTVGTPRAPIPRLRRRPPLSYIPQPASSPSPTAHDAAASPAHIFTSNLVVPHANVVPGLRVSSDSVIAQVQDSSPPEPTMKATSTPTQHSRQVPDGISSFAPRPPSSTPDLQQSTTDTATDVQDRTSLDLANNRGPRKKYETAKRALFTSNDQLQRTAGMPGVYFELPDLYPKKEGAVGRPKKQMIALFKSERLKTLPSMQGEVVQSALTENVACAVSASGATKGVIANLNHSAKLASKRKYYQAFDDDRDSQEPKRTLLDVARNIAKIPLAAYQSPYKSSSYISPYQLGTSSITFRSHDRRLRDSTTIAISHNQYTPIAFSGESPSLQSLPRSPMEMEGDAITGTLEGLAQPTQVSEQLPQAKDSSNTLQDEQLERAIEAVANIEFPDVALKLPASKDGMAGNLCLSADKKIVEFVPGEGQVDTSILRIQIAEIAGSPQISPSGVIPIELHITTRDAKEAKTTHSFRCLNTEDGYQSANNMRAKIATAMTILGLSDSPAEGSIDTLEDHERPFKCGGCGGLWKNLGGLVYHQTKSKTSCNPNYVPQTPSTKRKRGRPNFEPNAAADGVARDFSSPLNEKATKVNRHRDNIVLSTEVTGTGPAKSNLSATAREAAETQPPSSKPALNGRGHDSDAYKCKEIIMELLDANKNVFPAEKGLWFCYVAAWLRKFPKSGLPSYKACNAAVELLVDNGNIRKVLFYFRGKLGLMVSRTIITSHGVDPISPHVAELKEKVKAAYPEYYIPPEFAPPKVVQSMLEERDRRPEDESYMRVYSPKASPIRFTSLDHRTNSSETIPTPVTKLPGQTTRSGRISRAPQRLQLVQNSELQLWLNSEDDNSYDEESPSKMTSSGNRSSAGWRRSVQKDAIPISMSDNEHDGLSDSDASQVSSRERGPNSTETPRNVIEHAKGSIRRGRALAPKAISKLRPECWQSSLAYIQADNGAWMNPTPPKSKSKYYTRSRLPEPITYMQTMTNSAWNFRPFGHGVRPIHARPSRRVEGNPTAEVYDEKVLNGYRPVLMPARRKFGPALPSKNKLLSAAAKDVILPSLDAKGKKRISSSALLITEIEQTEHHRKRRRKRTELQEPSTFSALQVPVQSRRQTSVVSDADYHAEDGGEMIREDSVASEYGPSSVEQSSQLNLSRTRGPKPLPIDPRLDPLAYTLQHRKEDEPSISLKNNIANGFLDSCLEAFEPADTLQPGAIYMDRSSTFLQRSYSPASAEILSQWLEDNQEDNQEEAGNDQDYKPTGTFRQATQWESQGGHLLTQSRMKSRRLTALPTDVEGIITLNSGDLDFAVEIAYDHQRNSGLRKRSKAGALTVEVENRIILAVVVVRTLTGGLDKSIDWVLVSKMFPQFPMNFITRRWTEIQQKHKATIERLITSFQEWFLEVYERGEVAAIDYDHLVDYNWQRLVDLAGKELKMSVTIESRKLPATRSELDEMYTVKKAEDNRPWRDEYFGLLQPVYKRMESASLEQFTTPIIDLPRNDIGIDELRVARSWARASILTPVGIYDPMFATEKLALLDPGQVKAATNTLLASRVLMQRNKGRAAPGRGYEITDAFAAALRKHLDERQLTQAAAYKSFLDDALRANQSVFVEWTANEGQILAITNMQAHGRIRLEPRDVPNNRFGLTDGDYQTKRMDKSRLRFRMQIAPTESYLFDAAIPIPANCTGSLEPVEAPRGVAGAITLWYDISDKLMPAMWKKVLCALLGTLALRPSAPVKELVRLFSPAIEEWELRLLLDWGVKVGALTVLRDGHDGWTVGEWWWLVGGRAELHGNV